MLVVCSQHLILRVILPLNNRELLVVAVKAADEHLVCLIIFPKAGDATGYQNSYSVAMDFINGEILPTMNVQGF